jgi:TPP-dependent pyruvate/acetoin dehydrogenase alpha subunit
MVTSTEFTTTEPATEDCVLTDNDRLSLLRYMVLMRGVEERGMSLYKQGKIPGSFYDGRGQEAVSVGATFALAGWDAVCSPLIRDLGAHLVRGTDVADIFRHYLGRENPISHGREGNVHFGDRTRGIVGMVSMLPDMMVVAVGMAMAFRMRREQRCSLSFFGDGATSRGDWHEAMNWAGVGQLPVIFVLENNHLAYSTTTERQFARNPVERARAYGMESTSIDGNDVEAVFRAVWDARRRAIADGGPTLIEAETTRMHGHGAHDDARYVKRELIEEWAKRDPISVYRAKLEGRDLPVERVFEEVADLIDVAVDEALKAPLPDPRSAHADVFSSGAPEPLGVGAAPWSGHSS